jgi:antitoxin ParD1/3/4
MPSRSSLNVSLTPELEKFVQERVKSGRYQTASEVVRDALRLLESYERDRTSAYGALKREVQSAAAEAEAEGAQFYSGEEVFDELRWRSAQRRKRKAS